MNNNTTYKDSPLGKIPGDWEVMELKNLAEKIGSGITPTGGEKVYIKEGRPFIRSQNVGWGNLILNDIVFIHENTHNSFKSTEIRLQDVFLNITGASIGRSALADSRVIGGNVNQHVCIIRAKQKELYPYYLNAFLLSQKGQNLIDSYQAGGNRQGLNFEQIKSFQIPLPPLPEQKAIATLLSTWDKAITTTQKLITQKEQQKKWLMQMLLTGKKRLKQNLQNDRINRIKYGNNSENSANSQNSDSDNWKEVRLGEVANEVSIKNKTDKDLVVLSCTKYDGLVPSLEYFGRKIFADDLTTYKIVPKNHFAYATNHIEEGSIGYQSRLEEALISPMYTVFKTTKEINDDFLFRLLKSHNYIHEYQKRMEGSIDRRGGLRWDEFSKIKVPVPIIEEQTAIAQVLQVADKEIQMLKGKAEKLKEQKKGLMQVLLTGKKRLDLKQ